MAKIAIIGAGFAGHTAAMYLGDALGKDHEITVINKHEDFVFIPSLVWVGVDQMNLKKVHFPLQPVYDRFRVHFVKGSVTAINPDGQYIDADLPDGSHLRTDYDYLVIAPGPHLNFAGTPGLGPEHGTTYSICNIPHALEARDHYLKAVARMEKGENQRIVIGTGHPLSACQGAAFEYITNIHHDLRRRNLRDRADLVWLSNEPELGDFGVRGVKTIFKKRVVSGADFIGAIFRENGIRWEIQKGVTGVEPGVIHWENYDGHTGDTPYDFAMLIPQFTGVHFNFVGDNGADRSERNDERAAAGATRNGRDRRPA